ncbi:MAG: transposase, partial [Kiritimatiellaeota bacterium]|nr:transposase [Kiritimatiellota bacterium]
MAHTRIILPETAHYHCVSRVRGQDMLLKDSEKKRFRGMIEQVAGFSGVEVKTYCIMDNHFHLIVKVPKWREVDDKELIARMRSLYGDMKTDARLLSWELWAEKGDTAKVDAEKAALRKRMFNLPDFFKTLKDRFTRDFNRRSDCSGTFWSARFQSVLLAPESGVLTNVGAYADLNPVRVKVVKKAEDYEFSGFGAAARGDKDALEGISGLVNPAGNKRMSAEEAFEKYRRVIN